MLSTRSLTVVFLIPVLSSAQQFGTKKGVVASVGGSSSGSLMPLFQMLLALGIVFVLLKFALPKLVGKLNKKLITGVDSSIRIEESANFAGGSLYIVTARSKTLLLSVGSSGVACVADLTPTIAAPEQPPFADYLEACSEPVQIERISPRPSVDPQPDPAEIRRALDRLARLAS